MYLFLHILSLHKYCVLSLSLSSSKILLGHLHAAATDRQLDNLAGGHLLLQR